MHFVLTLLIWEELRHQFRAQDDSPPQPNHKPEEDLGKQTDGMKINCEVNIFSLTMYSILSPFFLTEGKAAHLLGQGETKERQVIQKTKHNSSKQKP